MSVQPVEITRRGRVMYADHVADRARELHAAGFPKKRIAKIVADEFGLPAPPTANTITAWVDPELAERWKDANRIRKRHRLRSATLSVVQGAARSDDWKLERMRALREGGLSYRAVAAVMSLDFPDDPVTEDQVRYALAVDDTTWRTGRSAA